MLQGVEKAKIDVHPDQIQCMAWNYDGSMIATTCKDKQIRIIDPRTGQVAQTVAGHQVPKPVAAARPCVCARDPTVAFYTCGPCHGRAGHVDMVAGRKGVAVLLPRQVRPAADNGLLQAGIHSRTTRLDST